MTVPLASMREALHPKALQRKKEGEKSPSRTANDKGVLPSSTPMRFTGLLPVLLRGETISHGSGRVR